MKKFIVLALVFGCLSNAVLAEDKKEIRLFDGKSFTGWDGDTNKTWRIENGALVGGSLTETVPHNEFLATTRSFTNFVLKLKFKMEGSEGFINAGVQVQSQRVPNHFEMSGYQADIGDGWWGALYDESRRNKVLAAAKPGTNEVIRKNDWNDYEIRCQGNRIQLFINGHQTVDYTEEDPKIPQHGRIGLQIHGGGKGKVHYKDLVLQEL